MMSVGKRLILYLVTTAVVAAGAMLVLQGNANAKVVKKVVCNQVRHICFVKTVWIPDPPKTEPTQAGDGGGHEVGKTKKCHLAPPQGGDETPCTDPRYGTWIPGSSCYVTPMTPQPAPGSELWHGHYPDGAVYKEQCFNGKDQIGDLVYIWRAAPPQAPELTPVDLAQRALKSLQLPDPSIGRSPSPQNSDQGEPYTWVHVWTWFWTDPGTFKSKSVTASAGPVSVTLTAKPTKLVFSPGDGSSDVTCDGPGRPWTEADGDAPPSDGGCGYRYDHVSVSPVTSTVSIYWQVRWIGTGGASGTMPVMRTSASSSFLVEQIQVVNR